MFVLVYSCLLALPTVLHPSVHPYVRPSVNFFSLSHLLQDNWSDFFKTCLSCSPSGLVVSTWIWSRSVYKCGRQQPTLIFSVIASAPKPLEEFHWKSSQCLDLSTRKWFRKAAIFKIAICPFTQHCDSLVIASPPRQLVRVFRNLPEMFP